MPETKLPQTVTIQLDVETAEDLFIAHAVALLMSTLLNNALCKAITLVEVTHCFADGTYNQATIDSVMNKTEALVRNGDKRESGK